MYVSPRGEKGTIEQGELTRIGPTQETGGQSIGIRLKLTLKSNMHRAIKSVKLKFSSMLLSLLADWWTVN